MINIIPMTATGKIKILSVKILVAKVTSNCACSAITGNKVSIGVAAWTIKVFTNSGCKCTQLKASATKITKNIIKGEIIKRPICEDKSNQEILRSLNFVFPSCKPKKIKDNGVTKFAK